MYFAHPKSDDPKNLTVMYGFGLNAIKKAVEQDFSKITEEMTSIVKSHAVSFSSGFSFLWGFIKNPGAVTKKIDSHTNPIEDLKKIPLIEFVSRLIKTYISTKDHLTEECFSHDTY